MTLTRPNVKIASVANAATALVEAPGWLPPTLALTPMSACAVRAATTAAPNWTTM